MTSTDYKKIILNGVSNLLRKRLFKKNGQNFKYSNGDLTYFIGLQSSQSSTQKILKVTFNIGIASNLLYNLQGKFITTHLQGHHIQRIGNFLEHPTDIWWKIDSENSAMTASEEICSIISTRVIPELDKINTTQDLINIWMDNSLIFPTSIEVQEYLALLFNAQVSNSFNRGM